MVMAVSAMAMAILAIVVAKGDMSVSVSRVASRHQREVSHKLRLIGGEGHWERRIDRVVEATGWRDRAARNRIRHLIKLEQHPSPEQVDQVRAAYARYQAKKIRAKKRDDQRRAADILSFVENARLGDPAQFASDIEQLITILDEFRPGPRGG